MNLTRTDLFPHAMKLVVPMRREFGFNVDIPSLLDGSEYAESVFEKASTSQNERLREEAAHLQRLIFGPRENARSSVQAEAAPKPTAPEQHAVDRAEAERQARYTRGVR